MVHEKQTIAEVIEAARIIQEFLWSKMNRDIGLEEFKRMFRKRLEKVDAIDMSNPHWKVELKKRLLQTAAISVNLINKIDNGELRHDGIHPTLPSNLPQYSQKIGEIEELDAGLHRHDKLEEAGNDESKIH